jgi:hypothetical protein
MEILRMKKQQIKMCFCGKERMHENDSDWRFGIALWLVLGTVSMLMFGPFGIIVAGLPLLVYVGYIPYNISKGHTSKCAVRKSVNDTLDLLSFFSAIG